MKQRARGVCGSLALILSQTLVQGQSTVEFQSGTHIEVTSGADICADIVTINGTYSGSGTQCGGALPVEMVGLRAEVVMNASETRSQRSEVRLSWTTANETDNAGWEVERRTIANVESTIANFQKVGFVEGAGTSSSPREYTFTDDILQFPIRHPPSRLAYRLKQFDRSGSFSYSHEAEVEVGTAPRELSLGQNYPNPFNPTTTIAFTLPTDGRAVVSVYDLLGREVATVFDGNAFAGRFIEVTFNADRLASGIYVCQLAFDSRMIQRRLILLK